MTSNSTDRLPGYAGNGRRCSRPRLKRPYALRELCRFAGFPTARLLAKELGDNLRNLMPTFVLALTAIV
jgi:hypothetical protein